MSIAYLVHDPDHWSSADAISYSRGNGIYAVVHGYTGIEQKVWYGELPDLVRDGLRMGGRMVIVIDNNDRHFVGSYAIDAWEKVARHLVIPRPPVDMPDPRHVLDPSMFDLSRPTLMPPSPGGTR